jgi:hypothetical protein
MTQPTGRGGAGRGQGRKPISPTDTTVTVTVRMTEGQRRHCKAHGGAEYLRSLIARDMAEAGQTLDRPGPA